MKQTALITGAAKRIGKSMAEFLASKGWNVILHYNTSDKEAKQFQVELTSLYPKQKFGLVKANLAGTNEVEKVIPAIVGEFGPINLLINNASLFEPASISESTVDFLDRQMAIHFRSPFILMRDFRNYCKKGSVVNMVDTRITSNKNDFAAYTLSKKLLWELTKMAALEFGPDIRVNAIAPGITLPPEGKDQKYLQSLASKIPMKKPGGIEPILQCLSFILDNETLTGQLLFADGGENLGIKNYTNLQWL
jgi:NAD(P)-dependent dehydrogenase (short-subunit alcohol dehydrogenase family)